MVLHVSLSPGDSLLSGIYANDPILCSRLFNETLNHPSVTVHNASVEVIQDARVGEYNRTTGQVAPWTNHVLIAGVVSFSGPLGHARIHIHSHLAHQVGLGDVNNITMLVYGELESTPQLTKDDRSVYGPSRRTTGTDLIPSPEDGEDAFTLGDFGCQEGGSKPCKGVPLVPEGLNNVRFHQVRLRLSAHLPHSQTHPYHTLANMRHHLTPCMI